jgi:hypothetical protein
MFSSNAVGSLNNAVGNAVGGAGAPPVDDDPVPLAAPAAAASAASAPAAPLTPAEEIAALKARIAHLEGGAAAPAAAAPSSSGRLLVFRDGGNVGISNLEYTKPTPKRLIWLIDTSGSMGYDAAPSNRENFLNRLEIAIQATIAGVRALPFGTNLTIIAFGRTIRTIFASSSLGSDDKVAAEAAIRALYPDDMTPLWGALQEAIRLASSLPGEGSVHIAILTDGVPSDMDARDIVPAFQGLLARSPPRHPLAVSCIGFGNGINGKFLYNLSKISHGMFGFIPEASMVVTVFMSYLALVGSSGDSIGSLGPVYKGLRVLPCPASLPASLAIGPAPADYDPRRNTAREAFLLAVTRAKDSASRRDFKGAVGWLDAFAAGYTASADPYIQGLCLSIQSADPEEGQVRLAVKQEDWFDGWGVHYIYSVLRSHELQLCVNGKDPDLRAYGESELFLELREVGIRAFSKLPPIEPVCKKKSTKDGGCVISTAPIVLSSYAALPGGGGEGGCFHGNTPIVLADGSTLPIRNLRRGMEVMTPTGPTTVKYAIKYCVPSGSMDMTQVNDKLTITPYHPIQKDGAWVFPCDHFPTSSVALDAVYNLVLDTQHHVLVGGVVCCTLGHGEKGPIIEHPYFGTNAVVKNLEEHLTPGDDLIVYQNPYWVIDPVTGLICETVDAIDAD